MDNVVIVVLFYAVIIFCVVGAITFILTLLSFLRRHFRREPIGQIVITRDISDGQNYMQLEIYKDKQEEFFNSKKVTLDVTKVDYASDAGHIMEKSK